MVGSKNQTPKLNLTDQERQLLKANKIRLKDIRLVSPEDLCTLLNVPEARAKELRAACEFQSLPSIGPQFAMDLIDLGFYSLEDLAGQEGHRLFDRLEASRGMRIDPCVEDQFRMVIYMANHNDAEKFWWDFTEERKQYRNLNGYPPDRPV